MQSLIPRSEATHALPQVEAAYYQRVARSFDQLEPSYDAMVESNPLHGRMRHQSLAWLEEAFPSGSRVLEIGCGPGLEAVHLARRGVDVTATDVSPLMSRSTRRRAREAGVDDIISVVQCVARDVDSIFVPGSFDGAFASFGPLNCELDLASACRAIATVLRPGAPFLASLVSRPAVMELGVEFLRGKPRKAFRRMSQWVEIDLYGMGPLGARAYSEAEIREALGRHFTVDRLEGMLVSLPPPYLAEVWRRLQPLYKPFEALDEILRGRRLFRGLGDHIHIFARRREP